MPAFFINEHLVKENLEVKIVTSAICDKLISQPKFCNNLTQSPILNSNTKDNNNNVILFFSIMIIGMILLGIIILLVKRMM